MSWSAVESDWWEVSPFESVWVDAFPSPFVTPRPCYSSSTFHALFLTLALLGKPQNGHSVELDISDYHWKSLENDVTAQSSRS